MLGSGAAAGESDAVLLRGRRSQQPAEGEGVRGCDTEGCGEQQGGRAAAIVS